MHGLPLHRPFGLQCRCPWSPLPSSTLIRSFSGAAAPGSGLLRAGSDGASPISGLLLARSPPPSASSSSTAGRRRRPLHQPRPRPPLHHLHYPDHSDDLDTSYLDMAPSSTATTMVTSLSATSATKGYHYLEQTRRFPLQSPRPRHHNSPRRSRCDCGGMSVRWFPTFGFLSSLTVRDAPAICNATATTAGGC